MPHLKLYKNDCTPPSRAVIMVAEAIGLEMQYVDINLFGGENLSEEYLKKNPLHAVPVLEDGDFNLSDSHAISAYLVTVYGKDDSLYPKDPKQRAIVDQRLHFDTGILYHRARNCTSPVYKYGLNKFTDQMLELVEEGYGFLETYLSQYDWLAGDSMTIADLCAVATISCSDVVHPIDRKRYPSVDAWWHKLAQLPCYKSCESGVKGFAKLFSEILAKNNAQ